jgi:hypothetical protein
MPAPHSARCGWWPITVVALIIVGLLIIDAFWPCISSASLSQA